MNGLFRTKRFKTIVVVMAALVVVSIAMFAAVHFEVADIFSTKEKGSPGRIIRLLSILLFFGSTGVCSFLLWRLYNEWQERFESENNAILNEGVTLCLAPRSESLPDQTVIGLWRRLSVWLKRQDDLPGEFMTMEVVGNRDRLMILVRIPKSMRRGFTAEINREFPETEIVECPPSSDQVPKGMPNVFVDPPYEALEKEMTLKWESFKMAAKPAYPLYESGGKENQLTALLGAVNNVHPQAYVGFQFLIRQAPPGTTEGWKKEINNLLPKPDKTGRRPAPSDDAKALMKAILNRVEEPIYECEVRAWAASDDQQVLEEELRRISDSLLAESLGRYNRLITETQGDDPDVIVERRFPEVVDIWMTATELGKYLHLPSKKVAEPYTKLVTASAKRMPPSPSVVVKSGEEKKKRVYGHYYHPSGDVDMIGQPFPNTHTHMFFIGPTGSGKSVCLANNVRSDFVNGEAGVLVIEPSGDVPGEIIAGVPPEYHNDIVILNPRSRQPFALNMCAVGTELGLAASVDVVVGAMRTAMGAGWDTAVRMQQIIVNALYVVMDALNRPAEEGASMMAVARFMQDPGYRELLIAKASLQAQAAVDFWNLDFASWNENEQAAAVSTAMRRISKWVGNPLVRRTLAMPYTTIDLAEMLGGPLGDPNGSSPKMVLLPLHVRMGQETKSLMGGLFINYFTSTMLLRDAIPRAQRRRASLHVDEFKNFVADTGEGIETLLAECRKYAANVNLYTQGAAQITGSVMTEVKINCLTKGFFKLSDPQEARLASSQMAGLVEVYDLQRLPPYHAYMQLAVPGGQAPPVMVKMLPPVEYDGEQPRPRSGFKERPPEQWRELVADSLPFSPYIKRPGGNKREPVQMPDSLNELEAPDLLRWAYDMERHGNYDEMVERLADDLSDDDFEALRRTRKQYDLWRVAELKDNPGLISDPISRIARRSEWEYGIPAWESDALYLREKKKQAGQTGAAPGGTFDDEFMTESEDMFGW